MVRILILLHLLGSYVFLHEAGEIQIREKQKKDRGKEKETRVCEREEPYN